MGVPAARPGGSPACGASTSASGFRLWARMFRSNLRAARPRTRPETRSRRRSRSTLPTALGCGPSAGSARTSTAPPGRRPRVRSAPASPMPRGSRHGRQAPPHRPTRGADHPAGSVKLQESQVLGDLQGRRLQQIVACDINDRPGMLDHLQRDTRCLSSAENSRRSIHATPIRFSLDNKSRRCLKVTMLPPDRHTSGSN